MLRNGRPLKVITLRNKTIHSVIICHISVGFQPIWILYSKKFINGVHPTSPLYLYKSIYNRLKYNDIKNKHKF